MDGARGRGIEDEGRRKAGSNGPAGVDDDDCVAVTLIFQVNTLLCQVILSAKEREYNSRTFSLLFGSFALLQPSTSRARSRFEVLFRFPLSRWLLRQPKATRPRRSGHSPPATKTNLSVFLSLKGLQGHGGVRGLVGMRKRRGIVPFNHDSVLCGLVTPYSSSTITRTPPPPPLPRLLQHFDVPQCRLLRRRLSQEEKQRRALSLTHSIQSQNMLRRSDPLLPHSGDSNKASEPFRGTDGRRSSFGHFPLRT